MSISKKATKKASNKKVVALEKNASHKKLKSKSGTKKIIFISVATVLVVVSTICLVVFRSTTENGSSDDIDFNQRVTDAKGAEFKPRYDTKEKTDFSIRFTDLECNEDCSNVSTVKIGDKILRAGEDFGVERGSIIITIYRKVMQAMQTGNYDIVVSINENNKTITVGVHISIDNNISTTEQNEHESTELNHPTDTEPDNTKDGEQGDNTSLPDPMPEPTQPEQPKTCSELQNCDFNLNDRYIIETDRYNFYRLPDGVLSLCDQNESGELYLEVLPVIETRVFYQIGNFTGSGGGNVPHATPTRTDYTYKQAEQYAASKGLSPFHDGWGCGGMGDIWREWTWQETIDSGFALDETKCATWGLSCGRW